MRTLLFGPAGDVPWIPLHEIATTIGDADVHDPAGDRHVITYPAPYNPRTARDASLPRFLLHRVRAFLRWRRGVRPILARYRTIVVWDPLIAVMLRLARPRGVRVAWMPTPPIVDDAWNAVLQRAAKTLCDQMIDETWFTTR
jgi:hypothetical protein